VPAMQSAADHKPLQFGILGTAKIAREFAGAVGMSERVVIAAIASRDGNKARSFADTYRIPRAFDSYEALLADPEVEAIYIPLPNSLHAPWTMKALQAGKHVLCEKPLATSVLDVRRLFAAARERDLVLTEGFPYSAQPHMRVLRELISSGSIGPLKYIQAAFGFTITDAGNIRLDPSLGGGALLDAGVYPVSLVRLLTGERPVRVFATAQWHASGVDSAVIATLEHADGILAQISCSFVTSPHRHALIAGSQGVIQTPFPNNPPLDRPTVLQLKRGASWDMTYEAIEVPAVQGFRAEAEAFERHVRLGVAHWSGVTEQESTDIMLTLEAIIASARQRQPVEVGT